MVFNGIHKDSMSLLGPSWVYLDLIESYRTLKLISDGLGWIGLVWISPGGHRYRATTVLIKQNELNNNYKLFHISLIDNIYEKYK